MRKEILGIIPARGGSKTIPKKNMVLLNGVPLIDYTIEAVKRSRWITRKILSSDDDLIMDYCLKRGIEVPFKRPGSLAGDEIPMFDVIVHALNFLDENEGYKPDYIILLQPTSPLRTAQHIDEALKILTESKADSMVSVVDVPHNFNPYSIMDFDGRYVRPFLDFNESNNLRQKKPRFYARNGPAVLAMTYDCVIDKKSLYGDKILPYFMKREESIDIDEQNDLEIAGLLLTRKNL